MHRRGPDNAAWAHFRNGAGRNAYLLNARLDIIDLDERANQPFRVGSKTATYNGELYNYLELREELGRLGVRFSTQSDTEVLVAGLDRLGWRVLDRCEGMWALAVYDEADGSLTLSRDRFGEKPLHLYRDGSGVYFASEPKAIFELLGRRLEPDLDQVHRYLVNGYRALYKRPRTFFRDLVELPAATNLRLDADGIESADAYWALDYRPEVGLTREEAVAEVRERLIRSVELRLRADVPLAFCMSGGVDSTALIAVAKRVCGYDVHGFTVEVDDARYDERDAVTRTVAALGLQHTTVPAEPGGFLDELRALVRYHDGPLSTISYFAHARLMRAIADAGYRVAVSGTAADELFTGYYDHHLLYLAEVHADPALYAASRTAWERHVRPIVRNPFLDDPDRFVSDPGFRDHLYLGSDRFAEALVSRWSEPFSEAALAPTSLLRNRMQNELMQEVVPVILHEDDLNSMYYSIENRSPYLDRALVELAYRIPSRHLIRDGYAKSLLREAVRGIAPDHVVDERRKVGFNAPIHAFLDVDDPRVRDAVLADGPLFDHVRRESVAELLAKPGLTNSESKFLFSLVNVKLFLEELG